MTSIRAVLRFATLIFLTLALYLIYLTGKSVLLIRNVDFTSWRINMVRKWAKGFAAIINLDLRIEGTPPEAPFLLVSNHLSYLDIIPYFILMDCVFVSKSEVRSWPIIGRIAKDVSIIFINRDLKRDIPRVNRLIEENITEQQGIVLFPEGTTTRGDQVKFFKSSLLQYAASRNFPVSYSSITYHTSEPDKPAHEWVCWWGDMTFVDHFFKMLYLKSIKAVVTFGEHYIQATDRKELAKKLHTHVQQQFTPTIKETQSVYD